jgi:hypothetical protein
VIRFSVGIEETDDLVGDVRQALDAVQASVSARATSSTAQ